MAFKVEQEKKEGSGFRISSLSI